MATGAIVSFPDICLLEVDRIACEEHRHCSEWLRAARRLYMAVRQAPGIRKDPQAHRSERLQDPLFRLAPGPPQARISSVRHSPKMR
jgi:hypothetical protein